MERRPGWTDSVQASPKTMHPGASNGPLQPQRSSLGLFEEPCVDGDIYILRNQGGKQTRYPFNYPDVIRGKRPEQNIVLQPGDLIVVP